MSKPLVSIIIPTHNRPDFLTRTLKSIIQQTYPYFEVIVVSNGINPSNKKSIEKLKDKRLIYKDQENSGGPASPRNHGMRLAKGKYIAFCDDDDIWLPTKLEEQVTTLEKCKDYIGAYTNMRRFDNTHEWEVPHENGRVTFESLLYKNTVPISSLIVRKNCLQKVGFFEEGKAVGIAEDYEYLLRILAKHKLYHIDNCLIKYWSGTNRETPTTLSFKTPFVYLKTILSCYYLTQKKLGIPFKSFFLPTLYHTWNMFKSIGYLIKIKIFT